MVTVAGMTRGIRQSNDETLAVQIEIAAAARSAFIAAHGGGESNIWCDDTTTEMAGGLMEDSINETRWPWDPSRPVAGQYEEWLARKPCSACDTSDGCEQHRMFTCAKCGKRVSWNDGGDDEAPDACSDCWLAAQPEYATALTEKFDQTEAAT